MKTQSPASRLTLRFFSTPLTVVVCLATRSWAAERPPLEPLRAEMRAEHYDPAIALADKIIAAKDPKADEAHYLKALALFHAKKFAEAATVADQLAVAFPQSAWRFKATFLKAQSLVEQKQFQQAAALYQSEATRLLAAERKQELVGVIVAFADKLTAKPDPNVPDAPKPDFQKAYNLYTKALGMEISRDFRDELAVQESPRHPASRQRRPGGAGFPGLPDRVRPGLDRSRRVGHGAAADAESAARRQACGHGPLPSGRVANPGGQPGRRADGIGGLAQAHQRSGGRAGRRSRPNWPPRKARSSRRKSAGSWCSPISPSRDGAIAGTASSSQVRKSSATPAACRPPTPCSSSCARASWTPAIKTCREFLAAFPEGSRAVRAAWMIAEAYQSAGRADDAIKAYRDFIAGQGFRLPDGEAAQKFEEELRAAPATHLANLKMRAVFRIGTILGQQKKREEAIATWQSYVKDYPNGPQWSESQNAIIDAEFQMGMDALADQNEPLALQRFEEFLRAHPLDERSPRILYLFGAVQEAKARALEEAKGDKAAIESSYRKAIEEWTKLVSKYPQSPEARTALMKSAGIHEEKFGEFEKALQIYRKLVAEFGYAEANASIARLTQKSLDLSAERTFRTSEKAVVKLKLRNIEKCTFRLHKIDLQAYFRKMHGITGVEGLDVSLIQPDKTWDFKPEGYAKYKPFEQEVEIPFPGNEPGAFVVTAGDDDWESTVLVLRSDLEVIVKSSRREVLAFVQNMLTGQPAAGVDILVSDGKAVAATGKTGDDGVFKTPLESLKDLADVRLFALGKGHAASFNLDLAGLQLSSGLTAKGYLYTDRPAYLPGETVALRGILREVRNTSYAVPENSEFKVSITDPQGRLLSEQTVKVSRFGTFDSTLVLPATTANGQYVIAAHQDRKGQEPLHFQGTFEVRSFKLEKIKLAMEFPRRVWFRGETIEANLQAAFYWGEPLADRPLRCTLPDGRSQTVTTDAEGKAKLSFDTTGMRPGTALTFTASLDGENVTATETVTLARLGFGIAAKPSQPVVIAGEPFDLKLTTTGADGKPTGETLKVAVLRVEKPKTSPVLALLPWQEGPGPQPAEVKESESEIKTDPATGQATLAAQAGQGRHLPAPRHRHRPLRPNHHPPVPGRSLGCHRCHQAPPLRRNRHAQGRQGHHRAPALAAGEGAGAGDLRGRDHPPPPDHRAEEGLQRNPGPGGP